MFTYGSEAGVKAEALRRCYVRGVTDAAAAVWQANRDGSGRDSYGSCVRALLGVDDVTAPDLAEIVATGLLVLPDDERRCSTYVRESLVDAGDFPAIRDRGERFHWQAFGAWHAGICDALRGALVTA